MLAMQELTPNDCVVWEIPANVSVGQLPTYIKIHLFRYCHGKPGFVQSWQSHRRSSCRLLLR